jgi:hypothetical protein
MFSVHKTHIFRDYPPHQNGKIKHGNHQSPIMKHAERNGKSMQILNEFPM